MAKIFGRCTHSARFRHRSECISYPHASGASSSPQLCDFSFPSYRRLQALLLLLLLLLLLPLVSSSRLASSTATTTTTNDDDNDDNDRASDSLAWEAWATRWPCDGKEAWQGAARASWFGIAHAPKRQYLRWNRLGLSSRTPSKRSWR